MWTQTVSDFFSFTSDIDASPTHVSILNNYSRLQSQVGKDPGNSNAKGSFRNHLIQTIERARKFRFPKTLSFLYCHWSYFLTKAHPFLSMLIGSPMASNRSHIRTAVHWRGEKGEIPERTFCVVVCANNFPLVSLHTLQL